MEEDVGKAWHRFITRLSDTEHKEAEVRLEQVERSIAVFFRALGGDGGLKIAPAGSTRYNTRRNLVQRIAGSHRYVELAWRNQETLYLPAHIALFDDAELNRKLYYWLAALAAVSDDTHHDWLKHNQALSLKVLKRYPGLAKYYQQLVQTQLRLRPNPDELPSNEASREQLICQALEYPGSVSYLPVLDTQPAPVYLWLHPSPPISQVSSNQDLAEEDNKPSSSASKESSDKRRREAERVDMPDGDSGLITMRMEAIFSWAEYVRVDRATDEDEDLDRSDDALQDMDKVSVARDNKASSASLKFDLDLPSAENDDIPLAQGILYPEWDWKKGQMLKDHCKIQPMLARDANPCELPFKLQKPARKLRNQFEALMPSRTWHRAQPEGSDIDLDALLQFQAERQAGQITNPDGLYKDWRGSRRDLACLLLADLSLSTDAHINNQSRVIDVIQESLFLFAEALSATGDRFGLFGFSSRKRQHVRFNLLKGFSEPYDKTVKGRIKAMRPGYYTRMGAAIRHASDMLSLQVAEQRLLLILTDGKPNDLDRYEGRHGAEDTRMAILEAKRQGLVPFCVTIDKDANSYLPHIFGPDGYVLIHKPEELPQKLPMLYARLTRH